MTVSSLIRQHSVGSWYLYLFARLARYKMVELVVVVVEKRTFVDMNCTTHTADQASAKSSARDWWWLWWRWSIEERTSDEMRKENRYRCTSMICTTHRCSYR